MSNLLKKRMSAVIAFVMLFTTVFSNVSAAYADDMLDGIAAEDMAETSAQIDDEVSTANSIEVLEDTQASVEPLELTGTPEKGATYNYNFPVMSDFFNSTTKFDNKVMEDGLLEISIGTGAQPYWHDASHGMAITGGNVISVKVAGNANIDFSQCQYGSVGTITAAAKNGSFSKETIDFGKSVTCAEAITFIYKGEADTLTFTFAGSGEMYLHSMTVANASEVASNGKIDAWDFAATPLDPEVYNNILTEDIINAWYPDVKPGTSGVNTPESFSEGRLAWVGGTNSDRLRTTNTKLTRWDEGVSLTDNTIGDASNLYGCLYVNSASAAGRYLQLTLTEDDIVTIYMKNDNDGNFINFVNDEGLQNEHRAINGASGEQVVFNANHAGTYKIYDNSGGKPRYYRILRQDATYAEVSGSIAAPDTIPAGYELVFTNDYEGSPKSVYVKPEGTSYNVSLPVGYTYTLSLRDANGYIVSSGATLKVESENKVTHNAEITAVPLATLSGNIKGLSADALSKLSLRAVPKEEKIYIPEFTIGADGAYSVQLETSVEYDIIAENVNDYSLTSGSSFNLVADTQADMEFTAKTVYPITITLDGLSELATSNASITFVNLNDTLEDKNGTITYPYSYTFTDKSNINLRDGVYSVTVEKLGADPVAQALTSNLKVDGKAASKTIKFKPVSSWDFKSDGMTANDVKVENCFRGLRFTACGFDTKGYLTGKAGSEVVVPVKAGDHVAISYCYKADFTVNGETMGTNSGSTGLIETSEIVIPDNSTSDSIVVTINGTTYFTSIVAATVIPYREVVTVGNGKDFQSVKEAVAYAESMDRPNDEKVTIEIDPGNYEEIVVVKGNNITLKNASQTPSIGLLNKGVDIDENAVRITSYYAEGCAYYSMGSDYCWDAETLAVNKENGYHSTPNPGGSAANYWNSTVVVLGKDFHADGIIFENSFNQYISQKESEDIVLAQNANFKKGRDELKNVGDTQVQQRKWVERASALGVCGDRAVFENCRVVGRQDSLYNREGNRAYFKNCVLMGAVDYIFGGATLAIEDSDLVLNTEGGNSSDQCYITAAQQSGGRGYLFYNCHIRSAVPGVETASTVESAPGMFGRPWKGGTSETVFFNTTIDATSDGTASMISPVAWSSSLGGKAPVYEFSTNELSGVDNSAKRADWSVLLDSPYLDGEIITPYLFTKGSDNWDPAGYNAELLAERELYILGDSTGCEYSNDTGYRVERNGFGMRLGDYFSDKITVKNLALSGRSSKDFATADAYKEHYQNYLNGISEGDFVIIAFGHNDEKPANQDRFSNPNGSKEEEGSFKYNLYEYYIKPALEKGATPILATPVARRKFNADGTLKEQHITEKPVTEDQAGSYGDAIRELAAELGLELIDSLAMTSELYQAIGKDKAGELHAEYSDAKMISSKYTNADGTINESKRIDETHLNSKGARVVSYLMAKELKNTASKLALYVDMIDGVGDIDEDGRLTATDAARILLYTLNNTAIAYDPAKIVAMNVDFDSIDGTAVSNALVAASDASATLAKVLDGKNKFFTDYVTF